MKKKILLIDANSLIHRAFHALPPFKTSQGELVNAVYGFFSILLNILTSLKPDYLAITFDVAKKTFRHEKYAEYKATRVKAPDELYAQFDRIKEIIRAANIPIFEKEGFEADDVLATLAEKMKEHKEIETYIATSDKDALQLVDEKTIVLSPRKGGSDNLIYTSEAVQKRFGLLPDQIVDFKAITGDPSDNIKGVKGIGDKGATNLLQKYTTLENIYEHLDEITGAIHDKLENDKEAAFFSKELVTLVRDVPLDFNLENAKIHLEEFENALPLFELLEFKSLITRFKKFFPQKQEEPAQQSLF